MRILSDLSAKSQGTSKLVYDAMTNNGIVGLPGNDNVVAEFGFKDLFQLDTALAGQADLETKDMINTNDLTRFIGTSITKIVQEAIEPELMVIDNLFQEIRYEGPGRQIEIGSVGAFHAGEVAEGGEYPESDWNYGEGDMIAVGVSKHGLKIRVTEEVIEDNLFDVFGLWLRMAGKAMARHKETAAIQLINEFGYDVYDNEDDPGNAGHVHADVELGSTTGRGIDGAFNGTMSADDIFEMYTWLYLRGFVPDTLLMNPLSWRMFMTDPEVREMILKGATLASKRLPMGSGANRGTSHGGMGLRYGNTGQPLGSSTKVSGMDPWTTDLNPIGSSWEIQPKYLPTPLKVIVSPYVSYTPAASLDKKPLANVIMADSTRSGLLLTKAGVSLDQWDDPERDIMAMKMKERWGLALFEQGKGVAVARNIVIDKNYVFDNVNSVTSMAAIDQDANRDQS